MRTRVRQLTAIVAAAGAMAAAACGRGEERSSRDGGAPTRVAAGTYVAVGASETAGIGAEDPLNQAWPKVLHGTAMEPSTAYVNLGIPGITVAGALARELPDALRAEPTVVTVWLNVNDILHLVAPADYERDLRSLVRALRQGGRATVLVANTPALDQLPAYRACLAAAPPGSPPCVTGRSVPGPHLVNAVVASYNSSIERVVREEGAVLVDLHSAGLEARRNGTESALVSSDGFHPSAAGHRLVAETFAATLRSVRR